MTTSHRWDEDACCIHCGFDGAEDFHLRRLGYEYPKSPCPVQDDAIRARNEARYQSALSDCPSSHSWYAE